MQTKQIDHVLGKPYSVPRERSRWPSLGLALAMHLGLLFFLWVGVHWQNTEPVAVEAEVWDLKVQTAAPPPEVATEPEPTPAPPPEPQVEQPAPPPPPPVAAPEPKVDLREAEIALERKKAKLKEEKAAAEERRKQELKEREEEKRELEKQKQKEKDKAEKLEKEKADKLEKAKQAKEKEKAAEEKAEKELSDKKAAAEKAAKAKKAAEEKKAADKAREAEMRRITGAAGAGTTGTAAKATAPRKDSGYVAALTSKIKSNIAYSGSTDVPGNPRAVFKIEQLPTGEIISVRKIKSSGLPAYDSSVENAINKSSPLPKKKDGTVEREIELIFEMKDLPK
ncbi:cell envelope integrity protein TolA [Janthinobacterium sp. SUN211]|uniref:cell envelope integrity protein TolA n=1 Tax=unclassified Janthinobacterium TaxID=2610881 RepID=UPI0025AFF1DF|nr:MULTISPECIES: cell envelope integrity protein TolA [unclassified Janthinobacterium]MDN2703511.1 cell envelope integrity protein TolA [Janthinobacterium sp. SUN100]MDO8052319.1 cell envelope integrity protein TolA [Janthinobacterium sp. SUN211]